MCGIMVQMKREVTSKWSKQVRLTVDNMDKLSKAANNHALKPSISKLVNLIVSNWDGKLDSLKGSDTYTL